MTSEETITLTRKEYDALIERNRELEDRLAALGADDGVLVPQEVALAIIDGKRPIPRLSGPSGRHIAAVVIQDGANG